MRALLFVPIALLLAAGMGLATCKLIGVQPGMRELVLAVAICFLASGLATVPLILVRGSSQYATSQAALAGSVLHLMTAIGAGGLVLLQLKPGSSFVYWLGGMYWTSLIVLVVCFVQSVNSAPPEAAIKPPTTPKN